MPSKEFFEAGKFRNKKLPDFEKQAEIIKVSE